MKHARLTFLVAHLHKGMKQDRPISLPTGSWGAGAFISLDHAWFQIQWPDSWSATNITAKELLPIVVALAVLWYHCVGIRLTLYSDNSAVSAIAQCLET